MPEDPKKANKPKPPTYADIVRELQESGQMPAPIPAENPVNPAYQYGAPDPLADAQHLAERQDAIRKLTSPVSPVLEIPQEAIDARNKLSVYDQLIAAWRQMRGRK